MAQADADTIIILSSELIASVMQEYFNKSMFKQKVEIVDLKPTETGYMFSIAFTPKVKPLIEANTITEELSQLMQLQKDTDFELVGTLGIPNGQRDAKGKFVSKKLLQVKE